MNATNGNDPRGIEELTADAIRQVGEETANQVTAVADVADQKGAAIIAALERLLEDSKQRVHQFNLMTRGDAEQLADQLRKQTSAIADEIASYISKCRAAHESSTMHRDTIGKAIVALPKAPQIEPPAAPNVVMTDPRDM